MFSRGLSGLFPDQEFSQHTALCHMMTNHIPQLLTKFHQNLRWRFEDMAKMLIFGPFLTLIPYNPLGTFFHSHQDTTLCKVSEKSDAQFSRYRVTHTHTDTRTNNPECTGLPAFMPRDQKFAISEFFRYIKYDFLELKMLSDFVFDRFSCTSTH